MPAAELRPLNGSPALWIDGEPAFPLLMMTTPHGLRDLQALGFARTHLYTCDPPGFWAGIDRYDFAGFDAFMRELLAADPQALIIPRIMFDAPADWLDAHPEELMVFATPDAADDPSWGGARHASWASEPWKRDAFAALRALLTHVKAQPWGPSIIGWHLGAGVYGEWHYFNAVHYPDLSAPFLRAYAAWLRQRYPGREVDATPPPPAERKQGDWGGMLDPSRRQGAIDWFTFYHQVGADLLGDFARIVKETTGGLVVAFNGYLPDLGINHEIDQRGFDRVLRNPDVDICASPHTYWRRKPGDDAIMRAFPGSVRLHGKMFWDEQDDRTVLAPQPQQKAYTHVTSIEESVEILWRGFAQALTQAEGLWYMEQGTMWYGNPEYNYYRDPAIVQAFEQMRRVGEASLARPRARQSEVAVISDLTSSFHLVDADWTEDYVVTRLYHKTMRELSRCGLPFDLYLLSDLEEMPAYKSYVFLDAVHLTDAQTAYLKRLRARGAHLGFFVAAGVASPRGLSLDRMRDLLGMNVQFSTEPAPHPSLPPAVLNAPDGVAESADTWYCPHPPIDAALLRRLLRQSGAHVYLESDDNLLAGCGYVGMHTASAGKKVITLPSPADWTDERSGQVVAQNADRIEVEAGFGETLLYSITE
ncbi:MAG: hypothetical protein ACYDCO_02835 [Armatimonadota bacterium]